MRPRALPSKQGCEIARPRVDYDPGEIAESFYIIANGEVHLSDANGKATSPGSPAGIDPLGVASSMLRTKVLSEKRGGLPPSLWQPDARPWLRRTNVWRRVTSSG